MYVQLVEDTRQLEPLRARWDELAGGCVFRSFTWLTTWWKHYGADRADKQLRVLMVLEGDPPRDCSLAPDKVSAILPCYLESNVARGKLLRLLGDGDVCSEHLDLLVTATNATRAATALAEYLTAHSGDWDLIDFPTLDLDPDNSKMDQLLTALADRECTVSKVNDVNCWSVELPATWEEFLERQSKSHRKQLRRLEQRVLNSPRAQWRQVKLVEEFPVAWKILTDLHQRRRRTLGEKGCFASPRWAAFHEEVALKLLHEGRLRMSWLDLDGQPAAAEYHFAGGRTTFVYQGGLDPDRLDEEPGRLSMIRCIQHAIAEGHRKFDLLRGDEPYKPHWRAVPKPTFHVQVVPRRTTAKLRFQAWQSVQGAAAWVRQVTHLLS